VQKVRKRIFHTSLFIIWGNKQIVVQFYDIILKLGLLSAKNKIFAETPTGVEIEIKTKANCYQIYFETNDLDAMVAKIKATEGIEVLHDIIEYSWGQRVFRFYDHDKHIVEVSERLDNVAKRFLSQGRSVQEIAEIFGDTVEHIERLLSGDYTQ